LKISTQNPTPQSKSAFTAHLKETKGQLVRLNRITTKLGKPFTGHTCAAMKGLIEEGSEWVPKNAAPQVMDAALIAAAQRVDHYEMAEYGTVHNSSELLGEKEAARLLAETLQEEKAANKQLTALTKSIDVEAKVLLITPQNTVPSKNLY
jgi:ferritin-like metal-binding protein YciE